MNKNILSGLSILALTIILQGCDAMKEDSTGKPDVTTPPPSKSGEISIGNAGGRDGHNRMNSRNRTASLNR